MPRKNNTPPRQPPRPQPDCSHKRRFPREKEALAAADYQMFVKPALELSVYKCDLCRGWHLTRQARK